MEKVAPITPEEVASRKIGGIPDQVVRVVNELIVKHYSNGCSVIGQNDIVASLERIGFKRNEIFMNGWLDIEPLFVKAGWKVVYDKPAFNEDYEPTFTFARKR